MKKYKNELKISITLLSFVLILLFVFGLLFIHNSTINEGPKEYLAFYGDNLWEIQNANIKDVSSSTNVNQLLLDRKFMIYSNNQYLSDGSLSLDAGEWNFSFLDKSVSYAKYPMIAYSGSGTMQIIPFDTKSLTNEDINLLNKYSDEIGYTIPDLSTLTFQGKITFDFDLDGIDEVIYIASNLYKSFDDEDVQSGLDTSFQLVLVRHGNDMQILQNNQVPVKEELDEKITAYEFFAIIKLPNESNYDILFNRYRAMGSLNYCPTLYRLKDGRFEMVKTCKEMES